MLDPFFRKIIDGPLNAAARRLATSGLTADQVTWFGFCLGIAAIPTLALGAYGAALGLLVANRLCDGIDGALARHRGPSDIGGFLDILLDFIVYAGVPLGFALADPGRNALAAAVLLFAFMGTASAFLAFAIYAEKHHLTTQSRGKKSIYYLGGITEGSETFLAFIFMCLFPKAFVWIALVYAALCMLTTAGRIAMAYALIGPPREAAQAAAEPPSADPVP